MKFQNALIRFVAVLSLLSLAPIAAQGAAFTWTGGVDTNWAQTTSPFNWSGGSGGNVYPGAVNSYGDTATISVSTNNPATLSTTVTLGGATTVLTIGNYSPANGTALDIASAGKLEVQGGISLGTLTTNPKKITIEGVLRNDGSSGTHYAISGGSASNITQLVGGTISSLNGGIWDFQRPVQGYGTISTPFTNTTNGTISANVSGQTLHITGAGTVSGTLSSSLSGAILSLESSISGGTINHTGEVDFNGATLSGITLANSGTGAFDVTGNSTLSGAITRNTNTPITIIGSNTLNLSGATFGNVSGGTASIAVGAGTLNNSAATASSISNGDAITLAGGSITNTGGGTFTINTQIIGNGTVDGALTSGNSIKASGGLLKLDGTGGTVDVHGTTVFTNGVAGDVLDLRGNINFGSSGFLYSNPSGNTGNGEVRLDGATLNGTINSNLLGQGAVNVLDNSTLAGTYNSSATLGINSGKQFNIGGSTLNVNVGSLTNGGTLAIGNGTLNNLTANAYTLGGGGSATLAGGSVTSTGGGGFTSNNTLSGYGSVTAGYTNNGKVIADGNGTDLTLAMQSVTPGTNTGGLGWFARNHGKLSLPSVTVNSAGSYNWGGDPVALEMVNSIGMSFGGSVTAGTLAIALLSSDRADVPAGLVDPVGVWAFNPGTLAFGSASMVFRYDDALAASLSVPESSLGLLGYNGTQWVQIGTTIDTTNKLLTTTAALPAFYQEFAIAQVPEPATLALLGLGALGALARRRRA